MSMDLTGIVNKNEYFTNHYFSTVFEENASATISGWNAEARESEESRTPWSLLRQNARQYYTAHDKFVRSSVNLQVLANIKALAGSYLKSLGYPEAKPEVVTVDDSLSIPVYLEMTKSNGAPVLWVLLSASKESDAGIMESFVFNADDVDEDAVGTLHKGILNEIPNEDLVTKILFGSAEPPRFVMLIGMNQIALVDRNKWNEKRYLQFELEEIFSRLENTTLQAMAVLLHKDSLCPDDGKVLLDELDEQSQKNASGVSQDLKYALRESIELLGNEVLYDMKTRLGRDLDANPVDAGQLTLECLRYMYRMLFVLFIESRPELGYAPIKAQSYYSGYSLESLRDIADNVRDDVNEVGDGYYLHETLAKLYELIYDGYPKTEEELKKATGSNSLHDKLIEAFDNLGLPALSENQKFGVDSKKVVLETVLSIYEDSIALENRGSGMESLIKTQIALDRENGLDIILMEEPENHLSFSTLRKMLQQISEQQENSQIIVATHNNMIASRLNLKNVLWITENRVKSLNGVESDVAEFFVRADDNAFLQLLLSKKVILVEGATEFLLLPMFYKQITDHTIEEDGVSVISCNGISYKRYLEIAKATDKRIAVVTDNDEISDRIAEAGSFNQTNVLQHIFMGATVDEWTWEACIYKENKDALDGMIDVQAGAAYKFHDKDYGAVLGKMLNHKVDVAYQMLTSGKTFAVPQYVKDAIRWLRG